MWTKIGLADQTKKDHKDEDASEKEKTRETESQIINMLTKDIGIFEHGSWAFPYLFVVPVNILVSGWILYDMYGWITILAFVMMGLLLIL
jgi:hypothetical protein